MLKNVKSFQGKRRVWDLLIFCIYFQGFLLILENVEIFIFWNFSKIIYVYKLNFLYFVLYNNCTLFLIKMTIVNLSIKLSQLFLKNLNKFPTDSINLSNKKGKASLKNSRIEWKYLVKIMIVTLSMSFFFTF